MRFPDYANTTVYSLTLTGTTSITYTATEDCLVNVYQSGGNANAGFVYVDGVAISGYAINAYTGSGPITTFLKSGQTLEIKRANNTTNTASVYVIPLESV